LRCYRSLKFFDAHEHWEIVWLKLQQPEKNFLQALIQISAAFHHFNQGNRQGTASLLAAAQAKLASYPDVFAGIDVSQLHAEIAEWLSILEKDEPDSEVLLLFPRILEAR
jgi:uncharacterized protein